MTTKGIIYYTDSNLDKKIDKIVKERLTYTGLPIVSVSLKPTDFGQNFVLPLKPGIVTYLKQILTALKNSTADVVYFCEHDVAYAFQHFDFTPPDKETFYYNTNVWRWDYPNDRLITYNELRSLSGLCVGRKKALDHYKKRLALVEEKGWQLKYGFEPGTKRKRRGGVTDDFCKDWKSDIPNIDIRHKNTLTSRKCTLKSFKHIPQGWKVGTFKDIPGWDLKRIFNL